MPDRQHLLDTAHAALHADSGRPAPAVWHALAAMAVAPTDGAVAVAHLAAADAAPREPLGVLRATARLAVHRIVPGGLPGQLAEAFPGLAAQRQERAERGGPVPADVAVAAVGVRSDRDLAEIAVLLGRNPEPFEAWAQAGAAAVDAHLWVGPAGTYGSPSDAPPDPLRGASVLFAAIPDRSRAEQVAAAVQRRSPAERRAQLPDELEAASDRLMVTYLAVAGLRTYGFADEASALEDAVTPVLAGAVGHADPDLRARAAAVALLALDRPDHPH
jgi:hypothetical protein